VTSGARVLAVDHGEKRIGLAISDESGTIAGPLGVFEHVSRELDAARVAETARERGVVCILVGQSLDEEGRPNPAGRRAARFAAALSRQTELPILLWDESLTTQDARAARIHMGSSRGKRSGHLDDLAATVLLQSYLDSDPETAHAQAQGPGKQ
jgi:putative holliday junction resolvase